MREVYLQRWARSTVEHYEFDNVGFAEIEGYEYYAALANNIAKHGIEQFNGFLADLQVWGTPEQVTEKLLDYVEAHRRRRARGAAVLRRHAGRRGDRQLRALRRARCCPSCSATTSAATWASPTTHAVRRRRLVARRTGMRWSRSTSRAPSS